MRIVLDTNVLISAVLFGGNPSTIMDLVQDGKVDLLVSPFILGEFQNKLAAKFGFSPTQAGEARAEVEMLSSTVNPRLKIDTIKRKESDNRILECAVEAAAQVLVTGDMRDIRPLGRFRGTEILTPREFLEKYFPSEV